MKKSVEPEYYDESYYLRGLETGKSAYQNYRWLPELTLPMVMRIIDYLHIRPDHTILDYGCATGFVVKAFRLLHRQAWGFDISPYAIENVDPMVKEFCFLPNKPVMIPSKFDYCLAKDVLEHIDYEEIEPVLKTINAKNLFAIIPLGKDGQYDAPTNNLDKSHIICEGLDWWLDTFNSAGFRVDGIKDSYYTLYPKSHGFFFCKKRGK